MSQDTLSDLLRFVRLRGALFFHVDCTAPWVTEAPKAADLARAIMPGSEHVMEYHVVTHGSCWASLAGADPIRLQAGDVIVFPHGDAHVISSKPGMRTKPDLDFLFEHRSTQLPFMLQQGTTETANTQAADVVDSDKAGLLCGFFGCDRSPFNPVLDSLPRMIHVSAEELAEGSIDSVLHFSRLAAAESAQKRPGGEVVLERLSELMFVDLLRRYLDRLPEAESGWLAGLRDRHVGRVLGLMHDHPTQAWTMDEFSGRVGLSRSALHDRFVQFIGLTPMQYLTRWRMQIASRLLTEGNSTIAYVALKSGYDSEAAFSRAFRRIVGVSPSTWRRQRAAEAAR